MNITEWHKAESSSYPELLDKTSSEKYVIVRKNVVEIEKDETVSFRYDEKMIPKKDWEVYEDIVNDSVKIEKNTADIDYLMIMEDL